jgi:putative SOS response-associated peptidase YedK
VLSSSQAEFLGPWPTAELLAVLKRRADAPTQAAPMVHQHPETRERRLDTLRWGLVPRWAKSMKAVKQPINARAESAGSSAMFRDACATRRCIVVAYAFYEWRAIPDGKVPHAIAPRDDAMMGFAGICEGWRCEGAEWCGAMPSSPPRRAAPYSMCTTGCRRSGRRRPSITVAV